MKPADLCRELERRAAAPEAADESLLAAADAAPAETLKAGAILASITASYFLLRRGLALSALAFPAVLILGAGLEHIQGSISAYYHFSAAAPVSYGAGTMRNLFVGVLWAVGAFLFFYKGYSWRENLALDIAGAAAVLVALCPMDWPAGQDSARSRTAHVHYASAVLFFLATAYVCLGESGTTLRHLADVERRARFKRGYAVLGGLMVGIPALTYALHLLGYAYRGYTVLIVEVAGIVVFALFWLVKSREIAAIERQ